MINDGLKFNPANIVATSTRQDGQIVFLETENSSAGLRHITKNHGGDFAKIGISEDQIPAVITHAVSEGRIVGFQGVGSGRPIYEILINGQPQRIAVTTGGNGFIVGANPAGVSK